MGGRAISTLTAGLNGTGNAVTVQLTHFWRYTPQESKGWSTNCPEEIIRSADQPPLGRLGIGDSSDQLKKAKPINKEFRERRGRGIPTLGTLFPQKSCQI